MNDINVVTEIQNLANCFSFELDNKQGDVTPIMESQNFITWRKDVSLQLSLKGKNIRIGQYLNFNRFSPIEYQWGCIVKIYTGHTLNEDLESLANTRIQNGYL